MVRRDQLDRARDAIAQRDVNAIMYRRRNDEVGGDDRYQANADYLIASLNPDCGWEAALAALEDERAQGREARELLDRVVALARGLLARVEELGIDLGDTFTLELQAINDAFPTGEGSLPRGETRAR